MMAGSLVDEVNNYHKTLRDLLNSINDRAKILFGVWCCYNKLNDREVTNFVLTQTDDVNFFIDIRNFLLNAWKNRGCNVDKAAEMRQRVNDVSWDHEGLADENSELAKFSWQGVLLIDAVNSFFDWLVLKNIDDIFKCAVIISDISDYKVSFELVSDKNAWHKEIESQILFLTDLLNNKIGVNDISKYAVPIA